MLVKLSKRITSTISKALKMFQYFYFKKNPFKLRYNKTFDWLFEPFIKNLTSK